MYIEDDIEVLENFKWMTLFQIKKLIQFDNIVNMDTRTVISCIPYFYSNQDNVKGYIKPYLANSMFYKDYVKEIKMLYKALNDYKMFNQTTTKLCSLNSLNEWEINKNEIISKKGEAFKVVFADIFIEGREVVHWTQPLFEAMGIALFGMFICEENGVYKFLISLKSEIGCYDQVELAPSVQLEAIERPQNVVEFEFEKRLKNKEGIIFDTLLSEEGGRFYHEQNRNVIIKINKEEINDLPKNYFWVSYKTLNILVQTNNVLNIQLRNLLSVLEFVN